MELRSYLTGWKLYFQLAETPRVFSDLDEWLRRRPRARGVPERVACAATAHARQWQGE